MNFRQTAIAIALLTAVANPQEGEAKGRDLCPKWAEEMHVTDNNDFRMHALGCANPWGEWQRGKGRCERIAYRVSLHEFNYARIGRHGCVLMEDGSWAVE